MHMTIRVCEANGGVLPRQVLIDTDGHPVLIRTIFAAKKGTSLSWCLLLAEMVGFEPTCPVKDKTISSRSRYDRFDTSPSIFSWQIYDLYIANRP